VDGLLPPEFEVNLFRIAQETLNNISNMPRVEGQGHPDLGIDRLRLVVEDNGCGFEPRPSGALVPPGQRGFGLRQIAERAKMMGEPPRPPVAARPGHAADRCGAVGCR
jgi:signal transduction histidine kinase